MTIEVPGRVPPARGIGQMQVPPAHRLSRFAARPARVLRHDRTSSWWARSSTRDGRDRHCSRRRSRPPGLLHAAHQRRLQHRDAASRHGVEPFLIASSCSAAGVSRPGAPAVRDVRRRRAPPTDDERRALERGAPARYATRGRVFRVPCAPAACPRPARDPRAADRRRPAGLRVTGRRVPTASSLRRRASSPA